MSKAKMPPPGTWITLQQHGPKMHAPISLLSDSIISIADPGDGYLRLHLSGGSVIDVENDGTLPTPAELST